MRFDVRHNFHKLETQIRRACVMAGRRREDVTLIAVSKTFPGEAVDAAVAAGVTDVGENRVQELRDKMPAITVHPRFHLIGHLQSNKARDAVRLFDVIQTIDSAELAEKISKAAVAAEKTIEVLIQVNIGSEPQKSGVAPAAVRELALQVQALPSLVLRGLMAIPPAGLPEEARPHFRRLRELRDELRPEMPPAFTGLSMGMSEDFEVAIEEGATMIRVGRALFGSRGTV
jgi:pyridoxal phosphate enzyme (YggS family)